MYPTSGGTKKAIVFEEKIVNNSASAAYSSPASNSEAMENKNFLAGQASEFQMSSDLNHRLPWQAQSQQPLASPVTSEAGTLHQMSLGGHLGGHVKKKRGRPRGSKNKIKVKKNSGQAEAMPIQEPEGLEMASGGSILPQGSNTMQYKGQEMLQPNAYIQAGFQAGLQNQASMAAGLYNKAHVGEAPMGWPQQSPSQPICVNYIENSTVILNYPHAADYQTQ